MIGMYWRTIGDNDASLYGFWEVDGDFIAALESGIPSLPSTQPVFATASARRASGIALGIDRMVVLFTGAHDINEVIFGSISDQFSF